MLYNNLLYIYIYIYIYTWLQVCIITAGVRYHKYYIIMYRYYRFDRYDHYHYHHILLLLLLLLLLHTTTCCLNSCSMFSNSHVRPCCLLVILFKCSLCQNWCFSCYVVIIWGNTNRVVSNRVVSKGPLYPSKTRIIVHFVFWYDPVYMPLNHCLNKTRVRASSGRFCDAAEYLCMYIHICMYIYIYMYTCI